MMRKIKEVIVHCSATKPKVDIGVDRIREWHVRDNKWADIGYHYVVRLDGTVEKGRAEYKTGAHCYGHNRHSIGVCYVGGLDQNGSSSDTRTPQQKKSLEKLIDNLCNRYHCEVHGHNEYSDKDCPCFNAHEEYLHITQKYK